MRFPVKFSDSILVDTVASVPGSPYNLESTERIELTWKEIERKKAVAQFAE